MIRNYHPDPEEFFIRFQRGDRAVFRDVYEKYNRQLRLYIYPFVGRMELAEDIVADAFVKLFFHRTKVSNEDHLRGYLFVIARNQAIGWRREQIRQQGADEAQGRLMEEGYIDPTEGEAEKEQMMQKINGLIGLLPPAREKIFRMYFFEGLDVRAIAKRLNLTATTVRNQKNLALAFLREILIQ